jgi:hypothetical protein
VWRSLAIDLSINSSSVNWAIGESSDLIAEVHFESSEEAAKFSTGSLQEVK